VATRNPPERSTPPVDEAKTQQLLQRWADGKATLKDVRGYSDEELYAVAKTAYFFYYQGRITEARTLFQGLYAVNPLDPYFAKALGVIELAAGNAQGAMAAYDVAIKLSPDDAGAYVGRAEVKLLLGQKAQALEDLRKATTTGAEKDPNRIKAEALVSALRR
jgi:type III secretion system low calcium response chaperone LcrH/SycD